jgi:hypothetical protein
MLKVRSPVIVGELHVMRLAGVPDEADPPLVVDADALAISAASLQTVARHGAQLVETLCRMD